MIPAADPATRRVRRLLAVAGAVYLAWWFTVELLLPGSFNPLPGRLVVVALAFLLLGISYLSPWDARHLSHLFTVWVCLLVAHYCHLLLGNRGDPAWWVGAFVTFAAASMCLSSRREVAAFSLFALGSVAGVAASEGELGHSIYVPGLATILLLANVTKRSQTIARAATAEAATARDATRRADEHRFQLAAIVESSGDAIVARGLDGRVSSWNQAAERLFGYAEEEVLGRPASLLHLPWNDAEEATLIDRLAKGESIPSTEAVLRRKDGSEVDVSITLSPIRGAGGEVVGASIAARDISTWKEAEAEVLRAREAAEASNRELEAFSYSIAHDLRAPLRAIDGFSQVLLEDHVASLGEEAQGHLHRVREAAQRMGRLIDSLLALGRVTRVSIQREPVDLSKLARATAARLQASQPERAVEFVIEDGLTVHGDTPLLGAVIDNLLENAWKFTRNVPHARIELGAIREGERNRYFVRDNGAGFDMAFAGRLFGAFQRLHTQEEFEGTGVGLATVQRIVRRHGGSVQAEGKVGEGACVSFTLHDVSERGATMSLPPRA